MRRMFRVPNSGSSSASIVISERMSLESMTLVVTTNANVANRSALITIYDKAAHARYHFVSTATIPASTVASLCFAPNLTQSSVGVTATAPIPLDCILEKDDTVSITLNNVQAGDLVSTVIMSGVVDPFEE